MKCLYCAEEIKDEALLCRFCGAQKTSGQWLPPAAPSRGKARKSLTLLTSGWLLMLSGAWMLVACTSPVPLLGSVRGGLIAIVYNASLGAALLAMGYGLARRMPWALAATAVASAFYSLDKLLFIIDSSARRAALAESSRLLNTLGGDLGGMVDQVAVLMSWAFLAGWWGLVFYIYIKRSYFRPVKADPRS